MFGEEREEEGLCLEQTQHPRMSLPCLTPLGQALSIVIAWWGLRLVTFLRVLMTLKVKSLYEGRAKDAPTVHLS